MNVIKVDPSGKVFEGERAVPPKQENNSKFIGLDSAI